MKEVSIKELGEMTGKVRQQLDERAENGEITPEAMEDVQAVITSTTGLFLVLLNTIKDRAEKTEEGRKFWGKCSDIDILLKSFNEVVRREGG